MSLYLRTKNGGMDLARAAFLLVEPNVNPTEGGPYVLQAYYWSWRVSVEVGTEEKCQKRLDEIMKTLEDQAESAAEAAKVREEHSQKIVKSVEYWTRALDEMQKADDGDAAAKEPEPEPERPMTCEDLPR